MKLSFTGLILLSLVFPVKIIAQKPTLILKDDSHEIILVNQEQRLSVSMDSPSLDLEGQFIGAFSPLALSGDINRSEKEPLKVSYAPIKLKNGGELSLELFFQWSPKEKLLRKWARYKLSGVKDLLLLKEIILERLHSNGHSFNLPAEPGQNYPVFLSSFFAGIEFPVSSVRTESGFVVLAHQPGVKIRPGKWYESRKAVYGAVEKGREKEGFLTYIAANIPKNKGIHFNYNSWWTSPVPYSEKDILDLMKIFSQNMFLPYGSSFDSFCIDMGWSDPRSIWAIDTVLFPQKFVPIQSAVKKMKSNLGLWISPSNMYSPKSLDSQWAEKNGYETYVIDSTRRAGTGTLCCLGGERYYNAIRKKLPDLVAKYQIKQLKLDGYIFTVNPALLCREKDHGHEPGYLSIEPIAEALIDICRQVHVVSPDTWIETTCMGGNPSPWWLFYVNSVIGNYGSDTPVGRIPCPVYRESCTSARDFLNIQGAVHGLTPISTQEVLGVIHQSHESFLNDAVTAVMRGHSFLPFYLNPSFMNEARWKMLSDFISWAKKNESLIQHTAVLLPESWQGDKVPRFKTDASTMPYEPYGYSHCMKNKALIELRNPWIKNSQYKLKINADAGFSKDAKSLNIVSLYPEVRIYGKNLAYGDSVSIPLAPYETLVISASAGESLNGLVDADSFLHGLGQVKINKVQKTCLRPKDSELNNHNTDRMFRFSMEGSVDVVSAQADLLILLEGNTDKYVPEGKIYINGKLSEFSLCEEGKGRFKVNRKLWVFLKSPLKRGENDISFNLYLPESPLKISVWAWAKKPGITSWKSFPNELPQPESISLESLNLVEPFSIEKTGQK